MLWAYMAELWPNHRLPADPAAVAMRERAWLNVLGDVDAEMAMKVVTSMADREFPPTIGEVRTVAARLCHPAGPAPDLDAAWAELRGWHGGPLSHPALDEAAKAVGSSYDFRMSDNPEAMRAQFRQAYESVLARQQREAMAAAPGVQGLAELAVARRAELKAVAAAEAEIDNHTPVSSSDRMLGAQ